MNEKFVSPPKSSIRSIYTATARPQQRSVLVEVSKNGEPWLEYERNYVSLMRTFEPFRQLKDGHWRDYALVSSEYTRLEVLDLETKEVIAKEPYPTVSRDLAEFDPKRYTEGAPMPGFGFCPVDFYVPDWRDNFNEDQLQPSTKEAIRENSNKRGDEQLQKAFEMQQKIYENRMQNWLRYYTGQFGVYSGCVWGDDTSWKLRYVDLSQISEGKVTTDERFGYVPLYGDSPLKESVTIVNGRIVVPMEMEFNLQSGEADNHLQEFVNWAK